MLLAAAVAAKGSLVVFLIIILTTFLLAFNHWFYLIVLRAWEYMRRELVNPLMPAAAAQAKVYFVPNQPPPYQQQVTMYGVGGAFPSSPPPRYQSSVYNKTIQEVCRRVAGKILRGNFGKIK